MAEISRSPGCAPHARRTSGRTRPSGSTWRHPNERAPRPSLARRRTADRASPARDARIGRLALRRLRGAAPRRGRAWRRATAASARCASSSSRRHGPRRLAATASWPISAAVRIRSPACPTRRTCRPGRGSSSRAVDPGGGRALLGPGAGRGRGGAGASRGRARGRDPRHGALERIDPSDPDGRPRGRGAARVRGADARRVTGRAIRRTSTTATNRPAETFLEETYYHRIAPAARLRAAARLQRRPLARRDAGVRRPRLRARSARLSHGVGAARVQRLLPERDGRARPACGPSPTTPTTNGR